MTLISTIIEHTPKPQPRIETKIDITKRQESTITTQIETKIETNFEPVVEKTTKVVTDTFYRVQIYALKNRLPLDTIYYTHLKGYEVIIENGYYKYMLGRFKNYNDCLLYWKRELQPRYKQSFIVKYIDGKRVID